MKVTSTPRRTEFDLTAGQEEQHHQPEVGHRRREPRDLHPPQQGRADEEPEQDLEHDEGDPDDAADEQGEERRRDGSAGIKMTVDSGSSISIVSSGAGPIMVDAGTKPGHDGARAPSTLPDNLDP